jgi:hypothetical protein
MSEPRRTTMGRIRDAIGRRVHGPYAGIGRIEERIERIEERTGALDGYIQRLERLLRSDVRQALLALAAGEAENRRRLDGMRLDPEYDAAWSETRPLVSVTVATLGRPELVDRALPSILAQSYGELEVIVVGDGAGPQIERQVAALGDARVRFIDLGPRQPWTDDPGRLWLTGATRARNAAVAQTRGRWVVEFDDDDAMRAECLESLLSLARESRAEAAYGQILLHRGGSELGIGSFPPRLGQFSWAAGMYHAGLRFFQRELVAADLGIPGDWWLAERMLRAGVRFAMREEVLCDVYGSARREAALESGLPWVEDR